MIRKVWIVNQFANTPDVPGGTRQFELAHHLVQRGIEVQVFSSDYNLSKRQFLKRSGTELCLEENVQGVQWNWLRVFAYKQNNWKRILNMLSFCSSLFQISFQRSRPDLVIGSSPQIFAALTSWIIARMRRSHFYFEVRDLWPQVLIDLGGRSPRSLEVRVIGIIERFLYQHSDRILVLAQGSVDYVIAKGAPAHRVHWLPNSVEPEAFDVLLSTDEAKAQHGIEQNKFCLMYTGAHGLANALNTVVEAARLLDKEAPGRFQILLVGDGPEKNSLQKQAEGVACLEFREPLPKKRVPQLLRAADALVLSLEDVPLFRYGVSPNKLYDYYGAGKPVVVAVGGSINEEVAQHDVGIACEPAQPRALADAILKLATKSPETREQMGLRARALAENQYSRHRIAEQLWKLVEAQS